MSAASAAKSTKVRCHYDVLSVPRDADDATVKKAHRKLALRYHPDKNVHLPEGSEERLASEREFKLVQAAYECLSDRVERTWYDEHREMVLNGGFDANGGGAGGGEAASSSFLYDVVPYQHAGCYDGYDDSDSDSFYSVYGEVFEQIFQGERDGFVSEGNIDELNMSNFHLSDAKFGDSTSGWSTVSSFYVSWEDFASCLSYAWADLYDAREAPERRVRRAIDDENRRARKVAKKERNENVRALVRFAKRRDPRVVRRREEARRETLSKEEARKKEAAVRKKEAAAAREEWRAEAERNMAEREAADLDAGKVRLADLDSSDDEGLGRGGKRNKKGKKRRGKKKGKKGRRQQWSSDDDEDELDGGGDAASGGDAVVGDNVENDGVDLSDRDGATKTCNNENKETVAVGAAARDESNSRCGDEKQADLEEFVESSSEEEEEPDSWRCECCRKDFKSEKQLENHLRSKKHKEAWKKYEERIRRMEDEEKAVRDAAIMKDLIDELIIGDNGDDVGVDLPNRDGTTNTCNNENKQATAARNESNMRCGDEPQGVSKEFVESSGSSSSEDEEEQDTWRCECCRKDFKSEKQFENHLRSKKHKDAWKKYEKKMRWVAEKASRDAAMREDPVVDELDEE